MEETELFFETDGHIFVHAGLNADLALEEQSELTLLWQFFDESKPHCSGKVMVCGHSSLESGNSKSVGHAICIDTGACNGKWLACLDVETGRYWQASERGKIRQGALEEK